MELHIQWSEYLVLLFMVVVQCFLNDRDQLCIGTSTLTQFDRKALSMLDGFGIKIGARMATCN